MRLGERPRTRTNETRFEPSRTCRPLPAAWTSSRDLHGAGSRILTGGPRILTAPARLAGRHRLFMPALAVDVGQRSGGDRELRGVHDLDAGVLLPVERGHARHGGTRLTAEVEGDVGIVEPDTQVVLVGGREGGGWVQNHPVGSLVL